MKEKTLKKYHEELKPLVRQHRLDRGNLRVFYNRCVEYYREGVKGDVTSKYTIEFFDVKKGKEKEVKYILKKIRNLGQKHGRKILAREKRSKEKGDTYYVPAEVKELSFFGKIKIFIKNLFN